MFVVDTVLSLTLPPTILYRTAFRPPTEYKVQYSYQLLPSGIKTAVSDEQSTTILLGWEGVVGKIFPCLHFCFQPPHCYYCTLKRVEYVAAPGPDTACVNINIILKEYCTGFIDLENKTNNQLF